MVSLAEEKVSQDAGRTEAELNEEDVSREV